MDEFLKWFSSWLDKNPAAANFFVIAVGLGVLAVAVLCVIAFLEGREVSFIPLKIGKKPDKQGGKDHDPSQNTTIYKNSDNPDFSKLFEERLQKADQIVMIGTGFNILQREDLRALLAERLRGKCHIEIYAANPFSPNVQTRLIEEETGEIKPRIRKAGLISWLGELLSLKNQLQDKSKFILRLFPFYPTYAMFIFDERDYFYYPYGYVQLGTLSPVVHYSAKNSEHQAMIQFLDLQHRKVAQRSSDANLIYGLYKDSDQNSDQKPDLSQLAPLAVYIVPSITSGLYDWGSKTLGYDVRRKKVLSAPKWHRFIGPASEFGLHITVADALYCPSEADVNLICKEMEFLAREFRPFTINLSLGKDFPNERGIALVCQDKTGSLEALHHEMVTRVYCKAVASNYSLGLAPADRDQDRERAKLMIEHYHAPYILQHFKPHFSLLSAVPAEKKEQIYQEVRNSLIESGVEMSIEVRSIAVMQLPALSSDAPLSYKPHWQIRNENGKDCEYPLIGG